jgi:ParB family chromosome partitioning protein
MAKSALGKGLSALIHSQNLSLQPPALAQPRPEDRVLKVSLEEVIPSPLQPRKVFLPEQLAELCDSIREHGIIQPLIVRRVNGKLELIAGERRWRASRELGLKEVPVIEREASDKDVLEMALIENLQRADLNPIEEALAYQRLAHDFSLKQEEIAQRVGKKRATIANTLRLLDLTEVVRDRLSQGEISTGHAKVLLQLSEAAKQVQVANEIVNKQLTVRATEKVIQQLLKPATAKPGANTQNQEINVAIEALEQRLLQHFATNVNILHHEKKGKIEIDYYGVEDLNRIIALLELTE